MHGTRFARADCLLYKLSYSQLQAVIKTEKYDYQLPAILRFSSIGGNFSTDVRRLACTLLLQSWIACTPLRRLRVLGSAALGSMTDLHLRFTVCICFCIKQKLGRRAGKTSLMSLKTAHSTSNTKSHFRRLFLIFRFIMKTLVLKPQAHIIIPT